MVRDELEVEERHADRAGVGRRREEGAVRARGAARSSWEGTRMVDFEGRRGGKGRDGSELVAQVKLVELGPLLAAEQSASFG